MAQWYAQFNDSDKVVVGAGFIVNPAQFDDDTHGVTVGFDGEIPDLGNSEDGWTKKYNESTHELEDNV